MAGIIDSSVLIDCLRGRTDAVAFLASQSAGGRACTATSPSRPPATPKPRPPCPLRPRVRRAARGLSERLTEVRIQA